MGRMSDRVGIAVDRHAIRIVGTRGGAATWAVEGPVDDQLGLDPSLDRVLEQVPSRRRSRLWVGAAIGPHGAELKTVTGLPPITDRDHVDAIVRQQASTFFIGPRLDDWVTRAVSSGPGACLAARVELTMLAAIGRAVRRRGWELRAVGPTALALSFAYGAGNCRWSDGKVAIELSLSDTGIDSVRTSRVITSDRDPESAARLHPGLNGLGDDASRFADAFGAACLTPINHLAIDPLDLEPWHAPRFRRAYAGPLAMAALGGLAILVAPLGSVIAARRAATTATAVAPSQWRQITATTEELARATSALADIAAFAESRRRVAPVLGALAAALPDSTALVSVTFDGREGELTALTDDTTGMLKRMGDRLGATTLSASAEGPRVRIKVHFGAPGIR